MCLDILHYLTEEDLKIHEGYKVFRRSPSIPFRKYSISPEFHGWKFPEGLPKRRWIESGAPYVIDLIPTLAEESEPTKSYSSGWHVFTEINDAIIWRSNNPASPLALHRVLVKDIIAVGRQARFKVLVCTQIYIMEEIVNE